MKKFSLIFILSILISCSGSDNKIPDFSSEIDYAYKATEYFEMERMKDTLSYKYYDKNGKLLEEIGKEHRAKYSYYGNGKLKESASCRMYNCDIGWREILVYDKNGNHVGSKRVPKNIKAAKPQDFRQTKFYDENNLLVKELYDTGTHMDGEAWENWIYYSYKKNRITDEIQKVNDKTIWTGNYKYDPNGNLISIKRENGSKYETELFQYDKNKKLIRKSIGNNESLSDDTSFSAHNNSTTYKYDQLGRIVQEITFNHKGEEYRRFTYKYENKEQN